MEVLLPPETETGVRMVMRDAGGQMCYSFFNRSSLQWRSLFVLIHHIEVTILCLQCNFDVQIAAIDVLQYFAYITSVNYSLCHTYRYKYCLEKKYLPLLQQVF